MTFNVTNAADLTLDDSIYLLYGPSGIGKTHTTKYLTGKTLYVSIDRSEKPLSGNANIDIVKFNTHEAWTEWAEFVKWLASTDLSAYDNIVFDNMSELYRSMLGHMGRVGKNNRVPSMMNYQQVDFMIIDSARYIARLGKRVVFYAWETTDQWQTPAGQVFNRAYPELRDKILNNFMGLCQVVARLRHNEKTDKRFYTLQPSDDTFAKNQLDDRKYCLQEDIFEIGKESTVESDVN